MSLWGVVIITYTNMVWVEFQLKNPFNMFYDAIHLMVLIVLIFYRCPDSAQIWIFKLSPHNRTVSIHKKRMYLAKEP